MRDGGGINTQTQVRNFSLRNLYRPEWLGGLYFVCIYECDTNQSLKLYNQTFRQLFRFLHTAIPYIYIISIHKILPIHNRYIVHNLYRLAIVLETRLIPTYIGPNSSYTYRLSVYF